LKGEDVAQLFYTTNKYALEGGFWKGPLHIGESKNAQRKMNFPGLATYLKWIIEDFRSVLKPFGHWHPSTSIAVDDLDLEKYLKELGKLNETCPGLVEWPVASTRPAAVEQQGSYRWSVADIDKFLVKLLDLTQRMIAQSSKGARTRNVQCWNRQLRTFLSVCTFKFPSGSTPPEIAVESKKNQDALDVLYQLIAQRSPKSTDKAACGDSLRTFDGATKTGCSRAHRTSELMQIAILDNFLDVLTFSNCKSGLDRTGIYHAVQSAVDQLLLLYPDCTSVLAFIAVHFTTITDVLAGAPVEPQTGDPVCANFDASNLLDMQFMATGFGERTYVHVYRIFKNAVLKNLLEVGVKVTFASTGVPGLKYGGKQVAIPTPRRQDDTQLVDHGDGANPMIAPFLPGAVRWKVNETEATVMIDDEVVTEATVMIDGEAVVGEIVEEAEVILPLLQRDGAELYISNALSAAGYSAVTLLEDCSKWRGA